MGSSVGAEEGPRREGGGQGEGGHAAAAIAGLFFSDCFTLLCFVLGACSFSMRSCTYRDRESVDHAAAYLLGGWCGSVGHPLLVLRSARRSRATYKESTTLLLYVHD